MQISHKRAKKVLIKNMNCFYDREWQESSRQKETETKEALLGQNREKYIVYWSE